MKLKNKKNAAAGSFIEDERQYNNEKTSMKRTNLQEVEGKIIKNDREK